MKLSEIHDIMPPKVLAYSIGVIVGTVMKHCRPSTVAIYPDSLPTIEFRDGFDRGYAYEAEMADAVKKHNPELQYRYEKSEAMGNEEHYSFQFTDIDFELDEAPVLKGIESVYPDAGKKVFFQ